MAAFKYYKRGAGELDTSNFPDILEAGEVEIERLDDKAFVSLFALNDFLLGRGKITARVSGYVHNLRSDKDFYPVCQIYNRLEQINFAIEGVQHESTDAIKTAIINKNTIIEDLGLSMLFCYFVGADSSVHKFFPEVDLEASKVREDGKVTSLEVKKSYPEKCRIIIVDDILGGGATINMLIDEFRLQGFDGEIYMWTAYNEGIHSEDLLRRFSGAYIGGSI